MRPGSISTIADLGLYGDRDLRVASRVQGPHGANTAPVASVEGVGETTALNGELLEKAKRVEQVGLAGGVWPDDEDPRMEGDRDLLEVAPVAELEVCEASVRHQLALSILVFSRPRSGKRRLHHVGSRVRGAAWESATPRRARSIEDDRNARSVHAIAGRCGSIVRCSDRPRVSVLPCVCGPGLARREQVLRGPVGQEVSHRRARDAAARGEWLRPGGVHPRVERVPRV